MLTSTNGLGLSQRGSCTQNIFLRPKNQYNYERHLNIKETYVNEPNQARAEWEEINFTLISDCSMYETASLHRRRKHERIKHCTSPAGGVIALNNSDTKTRRPSQQSTSENLKIVSDQQYMQKSSRASNCVKRRSRTIDDSGFRQKTHHPTNLPRETPQFKTRPILSDTLRANGFDNEIKGNQSYNESQNYFIKNKSHLLSEKPRNKISSKDQHDLRSSDPNTTVQSSSNLTIEFHISGSLSFENTTSQYSCSELTVFGKNIGKRYKQTQNVFKQRKLCKKKTKRSNYCSKVFSISTPFTNDPAKTSTEKQPLCSHGTSADRNQLNRKGNEYKYGNEVQLFYVFDKPFRKPAVTKKVEESVDCSALCQTDVIKSGSGIFKKFYHKFLQAPADKDTPHVAPCGKTSIVCEANSINNKESFFKRKRLKRRVILQPNEYRKSAHEIEKCCNTSVQAADIKNEGSFFKRRKQSLSEPNEYRQNLPQDAAEKCANPCTHCQADGVKYENTAFKRLFQTVIEPVECQCVSDKLSQINIQGPKPPCTCGQSLRERINAFKNLFHNVIERVSRPCICDKLSQINMKAPRPTCTCAETGTQSRKHGIETFKKLFHTVIEETDRPCVCSKLSQINMNAPKPTYTCAERECQSRKNGNNTFKKLFHTVIEETDRPCVCSKLNQINMNAPKPTYTCAERECQSRKNGNNTFKRLFHTVIEPGEYTDICNKLSQINMQAPIPADYTCTETGTQSRKNRTNTFKRLFHAVIEPEEYTDACNKLSQINMQAQIPADCICAEEATQSRKYRNVKYERNNFTSMLENVLQPSECNDNMAQVTHRTEENNFKRLFNILMDSHECGCIANKLRQIIPLINATKPECTCAEANTQSRKYEGNYQRAGRESYFRDIGTSGYLKYTNKRENYESQEMPIEDMKYGIDDNANYVSERPVTINRRIGSNGGYNVKCCHNVPQQETLKCSNSSTFCQLDGKRNNGGGLKRLCRTLLQPKRTTPVKNKCVNSFSLCRLDETDVFKNINQYAPRCTNSSSLCHIDGAKYNGGLKNIFHVLIEAKKFMPQKCCKNRGTVCRVGGINYEENSIKRLCQLLFEPSETKGKANKLKEVNPSKTVLMEAKTQSRKYGGQQQRAGKEIFRKSRGTSVVPKQRCKKIKKEEEPVYEIIDEYEENIYDEPECTCINKEIGIGTNCNFTLGWFKDRLAYGEPKPPDEIINTKVAIEQWNEGPPKKVQRASTKIGASLKANSTLIFFHTNTGTQSRKYRKKDLRAGREKFYKEQQTSCVPKCKRPPTDGNNNNFIVSQPIQPPAPDRKAVRLGSDCSFCFEFYRDVPPESPENITSKDNETQNKNILSKFIRYRRAADGKETGGLGKSDASTGTEGITGNDSHDSNKKTTKDTSTTKPVDPKDKNKTKKEECQCENRKKKPLTSSQKSDQPMHIGSSVRFNFNFFKSISSPKKTNNVQVVDMTEKCSCGVLTNESDVTSDRQAIDDNKRVASIPSQKQVTSIPSQCDPNICNKSDDNDSNISSTELTDLPLEEYFKTAKKCIQEFMSKKNMKRLIVGMEKKPKVKKKLPQMYMSRKRPEKVCEAKCKTMSEDEPVEPDKPLRIGSSFCFGYDLKNVTPPKHVVTEYEERFPEPEDFKGSQLKTDLFRLILGKIRKRVKPKVRFITPIESQVCDPRECEKRKEMNKTWFTYILDNIRHPRQARQTEKETKKFFTTMLTGAAKKTKRCRKQPCCGRKQEDSGWFSYILSNIKQERNTMPKIQTDAERFFTQMLSETDHIRSCECNSRRRRRRRRKQMPYGEYRAKFNAPNKLIGSDPDLSDWTPRSRSSKDEEEKTPCRVRSECCFDCGYKNLNDSETESQSSHSMSDSMNYATN